MTKIYLIQYNDENSTFENKIKSIGSWIKYFDDNWIVETNLSAKELYEKISIGNENKSIFIIELDKNNYWGRMNTKLWDYLKSKKKN